MLELSNMSRVMRKLALLQHRLFNVFVFSLHRYEIFSSFYTRNIKHELKQAYSYVDWIVSDLVGSNN